VTVSIADQIKAAKRELAMRQSAYPRFVARGSMRQEKADEEIAAMTAIIGTLEAVAEGPQHRLTREPEKP
jgi:hypothetical protein